MKNLLLLIIIALLVSLSACSKDEGSDRFDLITAHVWKSDSLLADGVDASGPGQILEKFKGDIQFKKDGTGYFGQYTGTWRLTNNDANLVIQSPELVAAVTSTIIELTETSLKVKFSYPNLVNPSDPLDIRMTFKPK
jgi:hypothetical protein